MPETLSINNGKNIIRLNSTGTDNKNMSLFFPNGKFIYGGKDMPAGTIGATTNQFVVTSYEQPSIELTKINEPLSDIYKINSLTLKYNSIASHEFTQASASIHKYFL